MCLILIALDTHPAYKMVVAANRDEFRIRPTAPAAFWKDAPQLVAGRDLKSGGTWLGLTTAGRFAALTNYREPHSEHPGAPSRGRLVSNFLSGQMSGDAYLEVLHREGSAYPGCFLLFGGVVRINLYSNRGVVPTPLAPGIHGLSNHLMDTPWPKVARGKSELAGLIAGNTRLHPEQLFELLADRTLAPDDLLPDTGVGIGLERRLAPFFIDGADYGTRSSTVILVDRDNRATFCERTYSAGGKGPETVTFQFTIAG